MASRSAGTVAVTVKDAVKRIVRGEVISIVYHSGAGCSKLTTLLVNVSLKFKTLI